MTAPLLLVLASLAQAADWLAIQGTEPPDTEGMRGFGFVQGSVEGIASAPVTGLETEALTPFEGQRAVFNTFGGTSPWTLRLRRARVGLRGVLPSTDGVANAFLAMEVGQNPLTLDGGTWQPALMDASVTVRGPANVNVRFGRFKLPLANESLEAVHLTSDLVRFTPVTARLLMERDGSTGVFAGRVNGFRDNGVQLFGSQLVGETELAWAAMGSVGANALTQLVPQPTGTVRVQVSRLLDPERRRAPDRAEVAAWAFANTGQRAVADEMALRTRVGGGAGWTGTSARVLAEGVWAHGVLDVGQAPPFPGGVSTVDVDGTAWGATLLGSARPVEKWELGAVVAHVDSLPGEGPARRQFDEITGFVQYHHSRTLWVDGNFTWRDGRAPEGSADTQRILATYGPYGALMLTALW